MKIERAVSNKKKSIPRNRPRESTSEKKDPSEKQKVLVLFVNGL